MHACMYVSMQIKCIDALPSTDGFKYFIDNHQMRKIHFVTYHGNQSKSTRTHK